MFRIQPAMPAANYETYVVAWPLATHWRQATCEEVGCLNSVNGWVTKVDEATELGQQQAAYIRRDKTRSAKESRGTDGITEFTFAPGNTCYRVAEHKTHLDREPVCAVKGGDWRGNPRGTQTRIHKRVEDWVEDFSEHQLELKTAIEKG